MQSKITQSKKNVISLATIAAIIGIIAAIAQISGYSFKDFRTTKSSSGDTITTQTLIRPVNNVVNPKLENSKTNSGITFPKNKTDIHLHDKSKLGNVINGDSNKIEIKQEF